MLYTYSDLQQYWECPRKWAYGREWEVPPKSLDTAMFRGTLAHVAVQAYFKGADAKAAIADRIITEIEYWTNGRPPTSALVEADRQTRKVSEQAFNLAAKYVRAYGGTVSVQDIEQELIDVDNPQLGGHRDAWGFSDDGKTKETVLIELKTGDYPDIEQLLASGQHDFYALLHNKLYEQPITRIYLDVITPELVTRVERPPQLERGMYLLEQLATAVEQAPTAIERPHYTWACRRCEFFKACRTRDGRGDDQVVLSQIAQRRLE